MPMDSLQNKWNVVHMSLSSKIFRCKWVLPSGFLQRRYFAACAWLHISQLTTELLLYIFNRVFHSTIFPELLLRTQNPWNLKIRENIAMIGPTSNLPTHLMITQITYRVLGIRFLDGTFGCHIAAHFIWTNPSLS